MNRSMDQLLVTTGKKEKTGSSPNYINWEAIQLASKEITKPMQWFICKHATGMCGVGKFLQRWKETETANCPCCGAFEDAEHV